MLSALIVSVKEKLAHDPDSEIATTSLRVSLNCPVSSQSVPTMHLCNHLILNDSRIVVS